MWKHKCLQWLRFSESENFLCVSVWKWQMELNKGSCVLRTQGCYEIWDCHPTKNHVTWVSVLPAMTPQRASMVIWPSFDHSTVSYYFARPNNLQKSVWLYKVFYCLKTVSFQTRFSQGGVEKDKCLSYKLMNQSTVSESAVQIRRQMDQGKWKCKN